KFLRAVDPLGGKPLQRRGSGDREEVPAEVAGAHVRVLGEAGHGQRLVEVVDRPGEQVGEPAVRAVGRHRVGDELSLAAGPVRGGDRRASTSSRGGASAGWRQAGTMTVPALASSSRPYGVSARSQPPTSASRGAQIMKSYQGSTSSGRSTPNTAVGTASPNRG